MPTPKKSTKNIVSSVTGIKFRVLPNGLVKQVHRGGYVTTVHIVNRIFSHLYRWNHPSVEVVLGYGQTSYDNLRAEKNSIGGFTIGCQSFNAKNAKKLFRLSGVPNNILQRYFPTASAAAAGR